MNPYMNIFTNSFDVAGVHTFPAAVASALFIVIVVLAMWSLVWKGIALWHAARNHQSGWFIVLLVVNTVGILDILYILFFRENKNTAVTTTTTTHVTTASTPAPAAAETAAPTV